MRIKSRPEDFRVEEQVRLDLSCVGPYAVYRVTKRGVTTFSVSGQMARTLGLPPSDVIFPALKDKQAVAVQHACVTGTGPSKLKGRGYEAELLGRRARPLGPRDIEGNRFTVVMRDMDEQEGERVGARARQVARPGLPNYFDEQRFGSRTVDGGFIGKQIIERDAEGALRTYLSRPFIGDPRQVREFKSLAAQHWGDWKALFEAAPRPSNYRSVLTYLVHHPDGHRKALNLIPRRLLSVYLAAYQSFLWNRMAGRYLNARLSQAGLRFSALDIGGESMPMYSELTADVQEHLREVSIPLPSHRAEFRPGLLSRLATAVLEEEGLELRDLKARILTKAYLGRGSRRLLVVPTGMVLPSTEADDLNAGRRKLRLKFTLPPGSYATLVLKSLEL